MSIDFAALISTCVQLLEPLVSRVQQSGPCDLRDEGQSIVLVYKNLLRLVSPAAFRRPLPRLNTDRPDLVGMSDCPL